ncbi:hypothetical protein GLOTRDRAFT_51932 [Gloeophyllum trabeum ATCC 11539]|uniref:Uncharacterized protein n=1 Tax=Gloeophyllum trabeum (strain ATCC 11539 / FP-39264 / Madison 617) TaxID=670483 RepID=S7RYQ5_GLOTA|nr:uncharacterized protein GLOTRDRAFT_51932 [Gloeophyllum trabeum ATCC 11539]EPQ60075.1 hypothetical protein GLOTRDRAFT_51932 [Gloeophyllum trabeum ATCC 11539]
MPVLVETVTEPAQGLYEARGNITRISPIPCYPQTHDKSVALNTAETLAETPASPKKKKKKKAKKAKAKENGKVKVEEVQDTRPPVLCISRNKHWRYISSYHGPWLQLPVELLESLLVLNMDPATLTASEPRVPPIPQSPSHTPHSRRRDRGFASLGDYSPPDSPYDTFAHLPPPPPLPTPKPGKATPPPIDPGVFRSVASIRRLIDEASELSVRASSGLSAAALVSMRDASRIGSSPWATAQALGLNPLGDTGGGRSVAMSAMRVHRLRALAVQKLAAAYKADEIASSVMVMQGGSVFDDIAERVLKVDPNDVDARYVHFFHEKIPSRQLAESTTTQVLDELIAAHPHRLEFYRTRGIVHCFRDEYTLATKDFTHAIKEARAQRKARMAHMNNINQPEPRAKNGKKKKKGKGPGRKANDQATENGTGDVGPPGAAIEGPDGEQLLLHPSVLPDAPEPIEPQCFFLRAAAHLQHAVFLIEEAILKLEGIRKDPTTDGAELRLCYIENGRYGGVEIGNPDGPLGRTDGAKCRAYRGVLGTDAFREQVVLLLRKSIRDHEKFLAHFDTLEGGCDAFFTEGDLAARTEYAFLLMESLRPGNHSAAPPLPTQDAPAMFTTYHPLIVESHFSILLCQMMMGDFVGLVHAFARTAALVDGLEGYPVFLPPRSMAHAEFVEILERLARGWRVGVVGTRRKDGRGGKSKVLTIEAPPPPLPERESTPEDERDASETDTIGPSASSSSISSACGSTTSTFVGSSSSSPTSSPVTSPAPDPMLVENLMCARVLLAPVVKRQRERAEEKRREQAKGGKKGVSINIPMHGPRVEIVLAWLGATALSEMEAVA